jgi:hypothetical protein
MQRMRCIRRYISVNARGREAAGSKRRRIEGMDEVMRDPGVIRMLGKLFLQDRDSLRVSRVGLIGLRLRARNVERAEYLG